MLSRFHLETFNNSIMEFARDDEHVRGSFVLNAPYQRGAVWNTLQKQNLIKSLLMGIPIGAVYINVRPHNPDAPLEYAAVIDGQQRIIAMRDFIDGNVAVPADWFAQETNPRTGDLEVFIDSTCGPIDYDGEQVEGVRYSGLTVLGQGAFKRCTVGVCQANVKTVEEEAAIYLLINFGGVEQTTADQERAAEIAADASVIPIFSDPRVPELTAQAEQAGLQVWGYRTGGRNNARHVVAVKTKKAAAEAFGITTGTLNKYAARTSNPNELAAALSEPGVVFGPVNQDGDFAPVETTGS